MLAILFLMYEPCCIKSYLKVCFDGVKEQTMYTVKKYRLLYVIVVRAYIWLVVFMQSSSSINYYIPLRGPEAAISLMPTIGVWSFGFAAFS